MVYGPRPAVKPLPGTARQGGRFPPKNKHPDRRAGEMVLHRGAGLCDGLALMRGLFRLIVGLLLLPLGAAATRTVAELVTAAQPSSASALPPSAMALGGGFLAWLLIFIALPRPVRSYVLAHELTHALWGWLMGARVLRMNVSRERGSVTLTKTNVLITLAPYFFPLYTMLAIGVYYALSVFFDTARYQLAWLAVVGLTWGFHFTFTITTLLQRQTDIQEYGRVFSYALIYLLNVLGIGLWTVVVARPTLEDMVRGLGRNTARAAAVARGWGERAWRATQERGQ